MIEDLFPAIKLPLSFEQFELLPRNPAYKYEYWDGCGRLTPRPKFYHAVLELKSFVRPVFGIQTDDELGFRRVTADDWERLPPLLAAAFHRVQPFASLVDTARLRAAETCIWHTRDGADGPLIPEASLVMERKSDREAVAAVLVTLGPAGGPADVSSWRRTTPAGNAAHDGGQPHLTWIFVAPWHARLGVGTALLDVAAQALAEQGYSELASTFLLGNESSQLWHWRNGFRLLPHFGSMRSIREQLPAEKDKNE